MSDSQVAASRPLVALTTEAAEEAGRHRKPQIQLYGAYLMRLQEAGLTPVLVTPLHDEAAVREILSVCSGLVLSGGEDVAPWRYGEHEIENVFVTPERDTVEWTALGEAQRLRIPILAICRGIQVLNVFCGGTLWQDLPSQRPNGLGHDQKAPYGEGSHVVNIREGTRLHAIVGTSATRVNSYHHQAPKDIAPGLVVSATAEDGLVEGLETSGPEWVVGVQWHPERLPEGAGPNHPDRMLFASFASAVQAKMREPTP